ncbi:hypothetical protein [Ensifer aridi]|uniref:hypothetical protein n=1 Tax=Ensifer aridi TaxID=1708715 RepID=UPI000415EB43|nr:hypothetical protein [Ensifer aridi]
MRANEAEKIDFIRGLAANRSIATIRDMRESVLGSNRSKDAVVDLQVLRPCGPALRG